MPYFILLGASVGLTLPIILPLMGLSRFVFEPNLNTKGVFVVFSLILVFLFSRCYTALSKIHQRYCKYVLSVCVSLLIACVVCQWRLAFIVESALPQAFHNTDAILELDIEEVVLRGDNSVRLRAIAVEVLSETDPLVEKAIKGRRIQFSWKLSRFHDALSYPKVGERWQFPLRLKSPRGFANPGGFNYRAWLLSQNIVATGYVKGDEIKSVGVKSSRLNQTLRHQLNQALFNDVSLTHVGLFRALSFGVKTEIDEAQWNILRGTGTSHLMAISGLHIGLFAVFGYLFGRTLCGLATFSFVGAAKLFDYFPLFFSCAFALVYSALSGFALPTQRALLMVLLVNIALLTQRKISPFILLSFVWCVMVLHQPLSLLSPGLWLSFFAVASLFLIFLENASKERESKIRAAIRKLVLMLRVQWVLWACLVFVLIGVNAPISVISPIANAVAVPVVSLVVIPLVFLGLFLGGATSSLGSGLLLTADLVMDYLWEFLSHLASHSSMLWQLNISAWAVFFGCLGMFLVFFPILLHLRCVGLSLVLVAWFWVPKMDGASKITVLDVGQGLSVVGQSGQHAFVYDTGAKFSPSFDIGAQVLAPYLRYTGNRSIDLVVLSHGDNDHSGGFDGLLQHVPVDVVAANHSVQQKSSRQASCVSGNRWQVGAFQLDVIWPNENKLPKDSNDQSCVILVSFENIRMLLTGDIEKSTEYALLDVLDKLGPIDIVLAPHHGSNTSSTYAFIAAVQAKHVVFSHGYKNRYRHPSAKVVERYKAFQNALWSTAEDGAITFRVKNNVLDVVAERKHFSKPWFQAPFAVGDSVKK